MNELLLTPEEIIEELDGHRENFAIPVYKKKLLQAQLNKVLNQPKLSQPDGEGWWWFDGMLPNNQTDSLFL